MISYYKIHLSVICILFSFPLSAQENAWIRINQLGYTPTQAKVAVLAAKRPVTEKVFDVRDWETGKKVFQGSVSEDFGTYGPFSNTYRLDFSLFKKEGEYYLTVGSVRSEKIRLSRRAYEGTADFALRYMRQQRSYFNPFLRDSCHTQDGFTLYAESAGLEDSTRIDVAGGWHDASDYLQYSATSANATYHLLAAYRDFPDVFQDRHQANGLEGENGIPDVLDEARWGLDWLLKMHPEPHLLFNQIGDDRDHQGLRIPGEDPFYGRGFERPVYFIDGEPQQRGKYENDTKGTSSTAAKFSSAFRLGAELWEKSAPEYAGRLKKKADTALDFARRKPGVTQTVSVVSPYIYAEENWQDDMELAWAMKYAESRKPGDFSQSIKFARAEPVTGWMDRDTANHYQYYPFVNPGHYELAKLAEDADRQEMIGFYRQGIEKVWNRARQNVFYRGIPFIWCSNNLTVSFAIQCIWYAELSEDDRYRRLAQANIDWLFGVNPWGVCMIYGLPEWGNTPKDPHSAFTVLENYPIDGGLVDGPVYGNIFNNLIGIQLHREDKYADFQSDLAVYHDDYGDYSTNEPTMDGTASLIYLLAALEGGKDLSPSHVKDEFGAVVRGNPLKKNIFLAFTAHDLDEGYDTIRQVLKSGNIKASFFLTGDYVRQNKEKVVQLFEDGHYVGPHSDKHLQYADWEHRQTIVREKKFKKDLRKNVKALQRIGVTHPMDIFLPAYEWHNGEIVEWSEEEGLSLVNYTPGLRTAADYTYPEMGEKYMPSDDIWHRVREAEHAEGLNGYIILIHMGTDPRRKDKLYHGMDDFIREMQDHGYLFSRMDEL